MSAWIAWTLAGAAGASSVVSTDATESNLPSRGPRSGVVAASPQAIVTAESMLTAVRADAARVWHHANPDRLQASVEAVTWSDGSLGCAEPGRMYTQALVPGWRLVVSDGERELIYHASRRGYWVQCPAGRSAPPRREDATR